MQLSEDVWSSLLCKQCLGMEQIKWVSRETGWTLGRGIYWESLDRPNTSDPGSLKTLEEHLYEGVILALFLLFLDICLWSALKAGSWMDLTLDWHKQTYFYNRPVTSVFCPIRFHSNLTKVILALSPLSTDLHLAQSRTYLSAYSKDQSILFFPLKPLLLQQAEIQEKHGVRQRQLDLPLIQLRLLKAHKCLSRGWWLQV